LFVFADLNDSKNRINMCRTMIANYRLKRSANRQPGETLPIKHVCFIVRIDANRDD
jgi:hypothetical protein